jgi:uncharacterized protein YggE
MTRRAVLFLCLGLFFAPGPSAGEGPRTVTASGDAEIRVVPDEVILTLGVETDDLDLGVAKEENDRRVEAVIGTADEHGVPPERVRTDFLSINPRYRDYNLRAEFLGYLVRKTVVIRLRDISKFEALLSSALEAGANYVHGIDFQTTELLQHRSRARQLAIIAAQQKAHALAGQLGQQIGKPRSISEGYSGWYSSYGRWWGHGGGSRMSQNVVQNLGSSGSASADGPTAPGQISVTATVSVTFELTD